MPRQITTRHATAPKMALSWVVIWPALWSLSFNVEPPSMLSSSMVDACSSLVDACSSLVDTCPSVVDTCPSVVDTCSSVVDTCPSVVDTCSSVVGACLSVVDTCPSVVDTCPSVVDTCSSVVGACGVLGSEASLHYLFLVVFSHCLFLGIPIFLHCCSLSPSETVSQQK